MLSRENLYDPRWLVVTSPSDIVNTRLDEYQVDSISTPEGRLRFLRPADWTTHQALAFALQRTLVPQEA